jgi:hypothetical protein
MASLIKVKNLLHKDRLNGVNVTFLIGQSFRKHAETFINVQIASLRVASSQGEVHKQAE